MIEIKISERKIPEHSDRADELEELAQKIAKAIIKECCGDFTEANREIADFARNIVVYGALFTYDKFWGRGAGVYGEYNRG